MSLLEPVEMQNRLDRISHWLTDHDQDAVICTLGQNFQYTFGLDAHLSERLVLAVIPKDQPPKIILPSFEKGNFSKHTPMSADRLIGWEETENPFEMVKTLFEKTNLLEKNVVVSPQMPYSFFSRIQNQVPSVKFSDGLSLFENLRMKKTANELQYLRKASELSAQGIELGFENLREGITELELATIIRQFYTEQGTDKEPFCIVQFGKNAANPHAGPSSRTLRKGDIVLIDAGMTHHGYWGDITNTTFFGEPTEEFLKCYAIVEKANEAGVQAAKVGASGADVDRAARSVIEASGYGEYFLSRTGHGIGLDVHESPYIISTNNSPLELNNVFTVEPGIYIAGKFGIRIEDDVIAQPEAGERLSSPTRRYWEL
ncbi:MAG: M24 family metallopeptidase [Promethearchaeota archaeon]